MARYVCEHCRRDFETTPSHLMGLCPGCEELGHAGEHAKNCPACQADSPPPGLPQVSQPPENLAIETPRDYRGPETVEIREQFRSLVNRFRRESCQSDAAAFGCLAMLVQDLQIELADEMGLKR